MTTTVDVGVDLGTTVTKAVALDGARRVVARASLPTPWERPRAEWCERDPVDAVATVDRLLADLVRVAGDVQVRSVGFCSIAETGALVDAGGTPVSRLLAWHDPRGGRQAADPRPRARRGAALAHRAGGQRGRHLLQAALVARRGRPRPARPAVALPARAGLPRAGRRAVRRALDAGPHRSVGHPRRGRSFGPPLDALDAGPDLVPPRVAAGAALGRVRADHPVEQARGAVLTVAGHDHLVAAAALGAGGVGSLCDSMGTAEALVAAVAAPPPPRVVAGLVSRGSVGLPARRRLDHLPARRAAHRAGAGPRPRHARGHDHRAAARVRRRDAGRHRPRPTSPSRGSTCPTTTSPSRWPEGTDPYAAWAGVLARTREVVASEVAAIRAVGVPVDEVVAHRRLGQPALGGGEPASASPSAHSTSRSRNRARPERRCWRGGRPPGIRRARTRPRTRRHSAGWFTDPSA